MTVPRLSDFFAFGAAALAMSLAGCTTASLQDAAPAAALQPETAGAAGQATPADAGPAFSTPGTYPNLNIVPTPAAAQITAEQKQQTTNELRGKREQVAAQKAGSARDGSAELRKLGRSHAQDALREIEGE
jgi:hypothetical protein